MQGDTKRRNRLRDLVKDTLETALNVGIDLPSGAVEASAKAIADGISELDRLPSVGEVASIATKALETAGAAAGDAAEAAGKIAEGVVDGLGNIDLNT